MEPVVKKLKVNNDNGEKVNNMDPYDQISVTELSKKDEITENENDKLELEDDDIFDFPPDSNITEMLDEVDLKNELPRITNRYFTPYYKINNQQPGDDICLLVHSNRICMLTLAPSHSALYDKTKITNVNFKVSDKLDRASNKVSGKAKHGAQSLQKNSNICTISCENGKSYLIKCYMVGKLVEVNELLLTNPELLYQPPHKGGYIAIMLPNLKLLDEIKNSLLTQEQYDSFISQECKNSIPQNIADNVESKCIGSNIKFEKCS